MDDKVSLEDGIENGLEWDTASTPPDTFALPSGPAEIMEDSEPTLTDILSAVTTGNASIAAIADELKGVKTEITFIRQDMQKLRKRT